MNIQLVHQLLNEKNIKTIATNTSIKEDQGPWENHYKLIFKKDKWEFVFVKWERSDGREKILKTFCDEKTASKFFYFYQLHYHYFNHYLFLFPKKIKILMLEHVNSPCKI